MQELPAIFEGKNIRRAFDADKNEWVYSIVDVVGVLAETDDVRKYWKVLKVRMKSEGSQLISNCYQLKLTAADGKKRLTDVANTDGVLRLIQSISSPKAEPFKPWLAQVGVERLKEEHDPELAVKVSAHRGQRNAPFSRLSSYLPSGRIRII